MLSMRKTLLVLLIALLIIPFGTSIAHDENSCQAVLLLDFRARASVAPTSATYGLIVNLTDDDITLNGGSTDRAEAVEIHSMTVDDDDVMMMMPLADGLSIAPQHAAEFAPGGLHVMVIGLTDFFVADDQYELELDFGEAGEASVSVPILDIDEDMSEMDMGEPAATEAVEMGREVSVAVLGDCQDLEAVTIGGRMEADHHHKGDDGEAASLSLTLAFDDGAEVVHQVTLVTAASLMDMEMDG
jgi:copper(I)-binding protein